MARAFLLWGPSRNFQHLEAIARLVSAHMVYAKPECTRVTTFTRVDFQEHARGACLLEIERNAHTRARYAQHEPVLSPGCCQHLVAVQNHPVAIATLAGTAEPHFA